MDKKQIKTVDEYIRSFPPEVQAVLNKIRQLTKKTAPESVESVAYGMAAYKLNGKPLVYFAAFKSHIGFYPLPTVIDTFKDELAKYKHAKGSIQFQLKEPIPYDLIEKIVKFRVKENCTKRME